MSQPRRSSHSRPHGERRRSSSHRASHLPPQRRKRDSDYELSSQDRSSAYFQPASSTHKGNISESRVRPIPSPDTMDRMIPPYGAQESEISRKRSLVRPERRRNDRDDPNYHYRKHASKMNVLPSTTGNDPMLDDRIETANSEESDPRTLVPDMQEEGRRGRARTKSAPLKNPESLGLSRKVTRQDTRTKDAEEIRKQKERDAAQVLSIWSAYCHLVTFWCPDFLLQSFGKVQKAQQRAWREKIGLITIILLIMTFVGYLTFGFTATVCPAGGPSRLRANHVDGGFLIIHGQAYDLSRSHHPYARGIPAQANVLYDLGEPHGGQDASFMFQNVNGACKGLITAAPGSDVPTNSNGDLGWYFPCNFYNQDGSSKPNETIPYYLGYACHLSTTARDSYYSLKASSEVYYTWEDIRNSSRNLAVWGADVLDLDLLLWFNKKQVSYPAKFDQIRENPAVRGQDLTLAYSAAGDKQTLQCLSEIVKVGSIDTASIGCIASKVVLYVSLAFILSVVISKFLLALCFQWFLSKKYAARQGVTKSSKKRNEEIEDWTNDIYRPPPKFEDPSVAAFSERSKRSSTFLPTKSRFSSPYAIEPAFAKKRPQPTTMASQSSTARLLPGSSQFGSSDLTLPNSGGQGKDSRTSLLMSERDNRFSSTVTEDGPGPSGFIHEAVVPQPPQDWEPFGYPLAHTICLVTAYSEGADGIRTTLDSVATTDYPNSHKLMLVVCDGLIKGKGEEFTTPEIVLGMMKDHTIVPEEVQPFSYVAVASGSKRHNMAQVYSGFYDYGEQSLVPQDQQQRVPMVVIVKCGTPDEAVQAKPGNRGKRDSQIILMSFLQKVMFDERMTELEFELFNGIWKITGISPDYYEMVLMVDADTKVFPDSLTHMVSAMVIDAEIMGLCGETKIANKRVSWVTMIQVFEYFISHHLAKSFESVFGGVTCLPGCFSMYRIKAPKGDQNYWVPILANPDIVEHYSENVVDTLHKKNLLLLGEDRYLSTLMLRTFPKRKQVFVPQAVCKTTVPEEFKVLLSQRRRWINSTIHNLMELVLVRDLCGTFCFSMQFVVFIDLVGTLVLPAAIVFTLYLVIAAIIDSIANKPIPVLPLILLALILGLPGVLIVLTAHRWSYVLWMFIYLLSLPIWNGVLPLYSYWKFDDFSWGDTRKTAGEKTKKAGLEYEGEFDSSKITMKRWVDFEQDRRLRGPTALQQQRSSNNGINAPPSAWASKKSQAMRDSYHDY